MKNILFIDASLYCNPVSIKESLKPLGNNKRNSFEETVKRTVPLKDRFDSLILFCSEDFPEDEKIKFKDYGFKIMTGKHSNIIELLKTCKNVCKDFDNLVLVYADSPCLDTEIFKNLIELHLKSGAEYTFADNLPEGFAPEIMSIDFLEDIILASLKFPELVSRKIFDNTNADINRYFAEVFLPDEDISLFRLNLHTDTPRNTLLIQRLFEKSSDVNFKTVCSLLKTDPSIFRIWPRYVEIEITNDQGLNPPLYLPTSTRPVKMMDFKLFQKICYELAEFMPDVICSFSGIGEPLLHQNLIDMLEFGVNSSGIFSFILETDGIYLDQKKAERLSSLPPKSFQVIFRVDAIKPETYSYIRNKANLSVVLENIQRFLSLNPENKNRTFVQFVKLRENLEEMEEFWRFWTSQNVGVIIQKFNDYAGKFKPELKVADLSPLNRTFCWHMSRDLTILADGRVPVCRQDFDGFKTVGNLVSDSISSVWKKLEPYYIENYYNKWNNDNSLNPLCEFCDEWYVFNF